MLPLSVLTLALLGGFVFVARLNWTKYHALRSSGYRLLFMSAVWGVVFLFLATVLVDVILELPGGGTLSCAWHWLVPPAHSGKAAMAFLIGALSWIPLNWLGESERFPRFDLLGDKASIDREIEAKRNPLEVLFHEALRSRDQLVSVSVKNGKVYVGKVDATFNPAYGMQAIKLILGRSGYRNKTDQEVTLNIDYDETHASIKEAARNRVREELNRLADEDPEGSLGEKWDDANRIASEEAEVRNYEIAIPVEEVQSANFFDLEIYDTYFALRNQRGMKRRRR